MILLIPSNFLLTMRIHSYFCRILTFAVLRFFFDQTGRFLASGAARVKLRLVGTVKRLNVEHRMPNYESI